MKRLKTPQFKASKLKGSDLKVPPVVADVFYDLRDRRLLPLLALIVVAIFAVPIVLAGGSAETEALLPRTVAPGASSSAAPAAQLTVVEAKPGLRDYHRRLRDRTPADPFDQKFSGPARSTQLNPQTTTSENASGGGTGSESASTTVDVTDVTTESTTTVTPPPSGGSGDSGGSSSGGSSSGSGGEPQGVLFTFAADIRFSRTEEDENGKQVMGGPTTREGVLPTTPLPGEKAPVVTYMGLGSEGGHALLMVSNHVTAVYGDAKCLSGTDTCQLLEVEPGFPETFVYGENDVRYKVNVLKIRAVPLEHD
jgi:hypothetical protein